MNAAEIVTLQVGHYSNFVGSHWWNCQESSFVYDPKVASQSPKEINHDVLYREGQTVKGEVTYTPRLVSFDLYNSLGSIRREGVLYEAAGEDDHVKWQGDVTLHQTTAADKNPYLLDLEREDSSDADDKDGNGRSTNKMEGQQDILASQNDSVKTTQSQDSPIIIQGGNRPYYQLDDTVKVWSDYLRTSLHSRTIHLIKQHQHNNPEDPFDVYGVGQQVFSSTESIDAMEDRVRFFTEECDRLQGFHILLDTHNAFGGVASPILSYLADEYPNKPRISVSLTPASPPDQTPRQRSCRIINSALSLQSCVQHNSLHLPLSMASGLWKSLGAPISLPNIQYQASLDYHTSAILATALDTVTLPYRKVDNSFKMTDVTSAFGWGGRKVCGLAASLPLPLCPDMALADYLMTLEGRDPWTSLTPHMTPSVEHQQPTFQSCVVRGLPSNHLTSSDPKSSNLSNQLSSCSTVDDVLRLYLSETFPRTVNAGCLIRDPIKLDTSFPHIFKPNISRYGYLTDVSRPKYCGVESVPVMTSLQSGPSIGNHVTSLAQSAGLMNISKHPHFLEAGLEPDDYTDMVNELKDLGHCYEP